MRHKELEHREFDGPAAKEKVSSAQFNIKMKTFILAITAATAVAFAPAAPQRTSATALFLEMGNYDGKIWDNEAKKAVYNAWDPNSPRTVNNFNPFETWDGNSPDCSGRYPGETGYKDPARGDVNFQQMMIEREEAEARAANPKPGFTPGCPGCRN